MLITNLHVQTMLHEGCTLQDHKKLYWRQGLDAHSMIAGMFRSRMDNAAANNCKLMLIMSTLVLHVSHDEMWMHCQAGTALIASRLN